ncbi:uncharacterized protein LOC143024917 isoform X2 [Oratosquilla oratoria]|uniref:uncharacterized protein LOC143024917 isoform X2 n=1 Tax=Oratosquilla oratoria TaxID=337810 RepID=UPI003F75EA59
MEELAPDIFKGQKIIVTVDEANPDLLVVSFEHGSKCFQGVLLDSRKGRIPCGVYPPGGQFPPPLPPISENDDRLYAVKQRHTYCQNQESAAAPEDNKGKKGIQLRKSISLTPRFKNARMTVRLRPRQVLCSKCQSICNEKSENVSGAKGQKPSEPPVRGQTTYNEVRRDSRRETRQQHLQDSSRRGGGDSDSGRGKGRIPKMTISTISLNLNSSEASKEGSGKSRSSRHSSGESLEDSRTPSIPKMILSTSGILVDCHDKKERMKKILDSSDPSESKHRGDAKELKLRSGNVHKMTFTSSFVSSTANSDTDKDKSSAIPKLTILPLGQKKTESLENKDASVLDKMHSRKKRSIGSVEGLWDEEMVDEVNKKRKQDGLDAGVEKTQVMKEGEGEDEDLPRTTPVLKISFGREGRGMVMKIPAKSTSVSSHPTESETEEELEKKRKDISAKAAKKSLKKAKKEAQRKALNGGASPGYAVGGMSPRFGGMSPLRLGGVSCMSPARIGGFSPSRFGGASPARFGGMSPARAAVDITNKDLPPKKHKHKVKHKKKHKEDRKHKECEDNKEKKIKEADEIKTELQEPPDSTSSTAEEASIPEDPGVWNVAETSQQQESASATRQKLSISIKRLNKGYIACDPHQNDVPVDDINKVSTTDETGLLLERLQDCGEELERAESSHGEESSNSDEYSGNEVPNFPASALVMNKDIVISNSETGVSEAARKESQACVQAKGVGSSARELEHQQQEWQNVEMSLTEDGRSLAVGDVVWGKIHGFPWWPAKVVGLRVMLHPTGANSGNEQWFHQQQAHVSWFGSSTSSMMQADALQPFLEMFKIRHNKKKRGPYREAVRQATAEARQNAGLEQEINEEKQSHEQQDVQEQLQQEQQDQEDQQQLQQEEQEQQHAMQQVLQQPEVEQQEVQQQELLQQELHQQEMQQQELQEQELEEQEEQQQELQQQDLQQQELQQQELQQTIQQHDLQQPELQQQELQQQDQQLEAEQQQDQHEQHQLEHHQEQDIQEQELPQVEGNEAHFQQMEEEQSQELRHYQELHVLSVPVGVYPKQTEEDQEVTQQQQRYGELSGVEYLEREENLKTDVRFGNGRLMPYYEPKEDYLGRGTVIHGDVIQQTSDHLQLQQDDMEQEPEPQQFESSGTTDDFQHTQELGFEAQGELPSVTPEHLVGASPREVDVVS